MSSGRKRILTIDIGGSSVKAMTEREREKRSFDSGTDLSAKEMVAKVRDLTSDWTYDAVSVGYPGPVFANRPFR